MDTNKTIFKSFTRSSLHKFDTQKSNSKAPLIQRRDHLQFIVNYK